jgi:uncharacterized protein CbrC (UPF0167 family)
LSPLALNILEEQPLIDAEYYPGDLLQSVLTVDPAYREEHQDEWLAVHGIVDGFLSAVDDLSEPIERFRGLTQP